jgi:hypothetical protein
VKQFASESWVEIKGFINKAEYYQFNTALQAQLATHESDDLSLAIERLISVRSEEESL